jgi:hypothetical protein
MTLYLVFPLWATVALLGAGVLAVLIVQQRHRLLPLLCRLVAANDALWSGPGRHLLSLAGLFLLLNAAPLALVTLFGTYGAACAVQYWTAEQIRWAGWLIPGYEFSHTLIVGEFLGLAALLGTSGLLRLGSLAHQLHSKMRS